MADALLFRPGPGNGPPEWKVCDDDWIGFYVSRGWHVLGREREIRLADLDEVRESDETMWNRLLRRKGRADG